MADKQFIKGAVTGVLCASLVLGGGYVGLQKAGRAGSNVLSDVAVTAPFINCLSAIYSSPHYTSYKFYPITSIGANDIPKQVISGAPLVQVRSTAYEDLTSKALLRCLVVVSC